MKPRVVVASVRSEPNMYASLNDLNKAILAIAKAVPGRGDPNPTILFVGEAPGANEEIQRKPFVGRAGQVLERLIRSSQLDQFAYYITNIVKIRPTDSVGRNRPPTDEEVEAWTSILIQEIELLKPKVIVALGAVAASTLTGIPRNVFVMAKFHGQFSVHYQGVGYPVLSTYHPAATFHDQRYLSSILGDFIKVKEFLLTH